MPKRSKFYSDAKAEWEKKNTYFFTSRLQNSTDADLIERLEAAPSRQGEMKRLMRLGIAYEKLQKEGTAPTQVSPPTAASIDPETLRLARVGRNYDE